MVKANTRFGRVAAQRSAFQGILPFDQATADAQRTAGQFSTEAQTGADYAASRIQSAQQNAQRELDKLTDLQAQGVAIPQSRIDELDAIANPAWYQGALEAAAPVFRILEKFDRGRQFITLGMKDILGFDSNEGVEISAGNYWDVISGDKQKLIEELGVGVVGEDGMLSFSTILDDIGWEKTTGFAAVARGLISFSGEVLTDPFSFVGFGAHGLSKVARTSMLKAAVNDPKVLLKRFLLTGDSELASQGTKFAREVGEKGTDFMKSAKAAELSQLEDALRNGGEILQRYSLQSIDELTAGLSTAASKEATENLVLDVLNSVDDAVAKNVVDSVVDQTSDHFFNNAVDALLAKDFAHPALRIIADGAQTGTSTYLQGGFRVMVPVISKRTGGKFTAVLPGSRGSGRKLSNLLLGTSSNYVKNLQRGGKGVTGLRRLYENVFNGKLNQKTADIMDWFSHDKMLDAMKSGGITGNKSALFDIVQGSPRLMEKRIVQSGIEELRESVEGMSIASTASDLTDDELLKLWEGMSRVTDLRGGASIDEVMGSLNDHMLDAGIASDRLSPELLTAARTWFIKQHETLSYIGDQLKRAGILPEGLNNYTPRVQTSELRDVVDQIIKFDVPIVGDTYAHQQLRAIIEAEQKIRLVGQTKVGEAAALAERRVGVSALVTKGDPAIPLTIGNTHLAINDTAAVGGKTIGELNDEMLAILDEVAEASPRLKLPKAKKGEPRFALYNENPVDTMSIYTHDLLTALTEHDLIELMTGAGLVADGVRVVNQQLLAKNLQQNMGKWGDDALQHVSDELEKLKVKTVKDLADIDAGIDIADDLVPITVGGHTIQISKSALEKNTALRNKVANLKKGESNAAEILSRQASHQEDVFNGLRKINVPVEQARSIARIETKRELKVLLSEATRDVKQQVMERIRIAKLATGTSTKAELRAAQRVHARAVREADKTEAAMLRSLDSLDANLDSVTGGVVPYHVPLDTVDGVRHTVAQAKEAAIVDLETVSTALAELGDADAALMLRTVAEMARANPDFALDELVHSVQSHIRNSFRKVRARSSIALGDERAIAMVDGYMDQAVEFNPGQLDVGQWGPEVYADAKYGFHASDTPNPDGLIHATRSGDAGLSANPVRSANAEREWMLVYDLDSMPPDVAASLRAGSDVEGSSQLHLLVGEGALPRPVAILPTSAVRESLARRSVTPLTIGEWGEATGAGLYLRTFGEAPNQNVRSVLRRAADDPGFTAEDLARALEDASVEGDIVAYADELMETIQQNRDYTRSGGASPEVPRPLAPEVIEARKTAISAWHDAWAGKAVDAGEHINDFSRATPAPWAGGGPVADTYRELYVRLHGSSMRDLDALGQQADDLVHEFFQREYTLAMQGELTPKMDELRNAAQASLRARGLESEFVAWAVGNDYGVARLSLAPVEGATPMVVRRTDVLADWGANFPPGSGRGDHILVDSGRLSNIDGAVDELLSKGMPSKGTFHQLRPESWSFERLTAYFGDEDVAREAYIDIMDRLDDAGTMPIDQLAEVAQARVAANRITSTVGELKGLDSVERVLTDPLNYGHMFEDADVQRWFRETVEAPSGQTIEFTHVWMRPNEAGEWVRATDGAVDSVITTVPAFTRSDAVRRLNAEEIVSQAGEMGLTGTELRMKAELVRQHRQLNPAEIRELSKTAQERFLQAEALFEGRQDLYHTMTQGTDEVAEQLDNLLLISDELAARRGGGRSPAQAAGLGRRRSAYTVEEAVGSATAAYRESIKLTVTRGDDAVGSVVRAADGTSATRGVAVGTGIGEMKVPSFATVAEQNAWMQTELKQWAEMHSRDLSRQGAHIMIRSEGGEQILEIAAVVDTAARAKALGVDANKHAIVDLNNGKAISIPTSETRAQAAINLARSRHESYGVVKALEGAMNSNSWTNAQSIIDDPKKFHLLEDAFGNQTVAELKDLIHTETAVRTGQLPGANAAKANRQARKVMNNQGTAVEAAVVVEQEMKTLKKAALSAEEAAKYEAGEEVSRILREVIYEVGLDDVTRELRDPSLYPNMVGQTVVEASVARISAVKQLQKHAETLGFGDLATAAKKTLNDADYELIIAEGRPAAEHSLSLYGITGKVTEFKTAERGVAAGITEAMARWQALSHPEGIMEMGKQVRFISRAWKTMATIARPNFHSRNFIGAWFNNSVHDVGAFDYAWVRNRGMKYRRAMRNGEDLSEIFSPEDLKIIEDARIFGVFGEGFAAGDLLADATKNKLHLPTNKRNVINPIHPDSIQNQLGARAMMTIEDFHRLAMFHRYYDELGPAGARNMVNEVHFNYSNLTEMEAKIKTFVPFFVWTRNNVPLQIRLMIEQPGLATRYTHMMSAIDDNFGSDEDNWPLGKFRSPFAAELGIKFGGDQNWANLLFDPDVPLTDLASIDDVWKPASWINFIGNSLGPHVTLPLSVGEQNEWGSANAPMGWNAAMRVLDAATPGFFDPTTSAQGDVQVGYGNRNAMNTLLPFLSDYGNILGIGPNDPNQAQKLGIDFNEGVSLTERLRASALYLARGIGLQANTPQDARSRAAEMDREQRSIVDEMKQSGLLRPENLSDPQTIAALRAAGVNFDDQR